MPSSSSTGANWAARSSCTATSGRRRTPDSDAYFASRPRDSRIGAWASRQGTVISGRDELLGRVEAAGAEHPGDDVPRPPYWGGYVLTPSAVEFWQAGEFRLHDRFVYTQDAARDRRVAHRAPVAVTRASRSASGFAPLLRGRRKDDR